ncbi:hypothetical protein QOZ80_6BG0479260 [Eleusine coracana subsp. coracana]|nr:hypothetical protein QOZ80_6BG0479260 [Eleusine coracana subsp. coracana]
MGAANGVAAIQTAANKAAPLFSFGVIADVQYADIPDGRSFYGVPRYYRHSLAVLRRAVTSWNNTQTKPGGGVSFCINFGDIVDRHCPKEKSLRAVHEVLDAFGELAGGRPTYHMLGNHCLYNLPRTELLPLLNMPTNSSDSDDRAYYDFSPCPGFRIVVLDAYDFSALGRAQDHPTATAALRFLEENNPNADKNSSDGLAGTARRFVAYNGGVGVAQLAWLDGVLRDAAARGEKVVVCGHLPMDPGAAFPESLLWNYGEVMGVVHRYGCVKACFAGHDHQGGYCVDSRGVHHRALEAALECPPGTSAFGRVEVYPDRLVLVGSDRMADTEMRF